MNRETPPDSRANADPAAAVEQKPDLPLSMQHERSPGERIAVSAATLSSDKLAPGLAEEESTAALGSVAPRPPARGLELIDLPVVERDCYVIDGELARGGLGRVLCGRDRRLDRPVAIKELLVCSDNAVARFAREALVSARLQHPAIVPVYEAGRWPNGEPFYAMKVISGRSLKELIEEARSLDERLALLPHVLAAADAIAYAHEHHIIHRDLKPSNVMIGGFGETVVIDWGLAKDLSWPDEDEDEASWTSPYHVATHDLTIRGAVIGTPGYMPPEQARGQPVDERADVYALGAILYHLLAGQAPFSGARSGEVLEQVLAEPPPPPEQAQRGIPKDLATIVRTAMSRHPSGRYPSARELAEDLRRFQTGQLVSAHEYSRLTLFGRWLRRHRTPVAVTVVFLLVLGVLGALGVHGIVGERNVARRRSNQLILMQARSWLDRDPTAALAWLKTYPRDGEGWREVHDLAYDAWSRGIARHVLLGDPNRFCFGSFSPDGQWFAHSSEGRMLLLWNLMSGRPERHRSCEKPVFTVRFSPDQRTVAFTESDSRFVKLWDLVTDRLRVLSGHDGRIFDFAFSADGRTLVPFNTGSSLLVWPLPDGQPKRLEDFEGLSGIALSPDGQWLAFSTKAKTIRVHHLGTGQVRILAGHEAPIGTLRFSPRQSLLLSADEAGTLRSWDLASGRSRVLGSHDGRVEPIAFSSDGRFAATGGEDRTVRLWEMDSGRGRVVELHQGSVETLAFSPDGQLLASAGTDTVIRVWNRATGESQRLSGHRATIYQLVFSPDGRLLASSSEDKSTRLWPFAPRDVSLLLRGHETGVVDTIAFSSNGRQVATGGRDGTVRVWDAGTGRCERVLRGHQGEIEKVVFSPGGTELASAGGDGTVRLWQLASGTGRVLQTHGDVAWDVVFSPRGDSLASAGEDGTVRWWDLGRATGRVLVEHQGPVRALAFDSAGRRLASASEDHTVRVWDMERGASQRLDGHEGVVGHVSFSPDGRLLASAGWDRMVRLWDLDSGQGRLLGHHAGRVRMVLFSRDGRRVISSGEDGQIWSWDRRGNERHPIAAQLHPISHLALSPDGQLVAASSHDGTLRLWKLDSGVFHSILRFGAPVQSIAFSPDGQLIAAAGKDKSARLWPVAVDTSLPEDPDALRAWIEDHTSARIHPDGRLGTP